MKTQQITEEVLMIYNALKYYCDEHGYCQSWWLNARNNPQKELNLTTPQINSKCKILIKQGYIVIDKEKTSTSTGTCYRLTDKIMI